MNILETAVSLWDVDFIDAFPGETKLHLMLTSTTIFGLAYPKILCSFRVESRLAQISELTTSLDFFCARASVVASIARIPALLLVAAESGHVNFAKLLLSKGASENVKTKGGNTLLHLSAYRGRMSMVVWLSNLGAEVDAKNKHKETPLHEASKCGHVRVVDFLILKGANPNACTEEIYTPVHLAIDGGHAEVVSKFVRIGADLRKANKYRETPMQTAVKRKNNEIVDMLLSAGLELDTPQYWAVWNT